METWQKHHIQESQEVTSFPAGHHKAARNRLVSMTNTKHKNKKDPQRKHRLGTVSKQKLLEGLKMLHGANFALISDVDQDN